MVNAKSASALGGVSEWVMSKKETEYLIYFSFFTFRSVVEWVCGGCVVGVREAQQSHLATSQERHSDEYVRLILHSGHCSLAASHFVAMVAHDRKRQNHQRRLHHPADNTLSFILEK